MLDDRRPLYAPSENEAAPRRRRWPAAFARLRRRRLLEEALLLAVAAAATIHAESAVLFRPFTFEGDSMIHLVWMRRFGDPSLFNDPLTRALVNAGYEPPGIQAIYWVVAQVMDPVRFGAWLPVVLVPFCVWLVFRIVRAHTDWWPAAWLGGLLFLFPWDVHRFSGGLPRAFGEPAVLLTLYLLVQGRARLAAVFPPVGALLYPPAGLVAMLTHVLSSIRWAGRRPRVDLAAAWPAVACAAATGLALVSPRLLGTSHGELISESLARRLPEFHAHGQMAFFRSSLLAMLRDNESGFSLEYGGSVLCAGALIMLVVRPSNARLIRREVWWLAAASLAMYGVSWLVLFRLYLPQRYTQPLISVFCIIIAVAWRPTWEAMVRIGRTVPVWIIALPALPIAIGFVALVLFPLGPQETNGRFWHWLWAGRMPLAAAIAAGLAVCLLMVARNRGKSVKPRAAALSAVLAGSLLLGVVGLAGGGTSPSLNRCYKESHGLFRYLRTLPKNATIVGDPVHISCVPIETNHPVVISEKLYQVFDVNYLRFVRPRMFSVIRAYYGDSQSAIANLGRRYSADYIVVERSLFHPPLGNSWHNLQPFTGLVAHLLKTDTHPAALHLPSACQTWHRGTYHVYSVSCLQKQSTTRSSQNR